MKDCEKIEEAGNFYPLTHNK